MINLEKIAGLAKDSSTSGRKSLVSMLTDFFLDSGKDRDEQISVLFGDIVLKVLGQLEEETRAVMAKRISRDSGAPHELIKTLSKDSIAVAEPVLANSPVLTSEDLVSLAASGSMDHLGAIAGRETVDEAVTSVLVDRGNTAVLSKVAENSGASFAETSFLKLVDKARNDPGIQAALVGRSDLPEKAGRALLPLLTEELRERVTAMGADSTLVQLMAERAATEVAARAQRIDQAREESIAIAKDVLAGKTKIDEPISMFSRADRTAELGMLLAKVSGLPPAAVSQLLFTKSDKALIILCKANGASADAFKDVLTMRARRLGLSGVDLMESIKRYDAFAVEAAKRALEKLKSTGPSIGLKTEQAEDPKEARPFARRTKVAAGQ